MRRTIVHLAGLALLSTLPAFAQTAETNAGRPAPEKSVAKPPAAKARPVRRRKPEPAAVEIPPANSIPRFTPEQMPAQPPRVTLQDGRLEVNAQNSTFGDVMGAVRRLTGVRFESLNGAAVDILPSFNERLAAVVAGSPREVIGSLLDGLNLGYIMVSPAGKPDEVKTVVLTATPQSQKVTQSSSTGRGLPVPTPQQPGRPPQRGPMGGPQGRMPEPPPQADNETMPPPASEATANELMQIPPPGTPGQNPFGGMPGQQMQPPPSPPGINTGQPQAQPRTPAELLQMLQQRNQNQTTPSTP